MDKHYVMWIKADCCFCISARDELFKQKVSHTINIMDDDLVRLDDIKEKWRHSTVPIIVYREDGEEELIGGHSDLKEWFKNDWVCANRN